MDNSTSNSIVKPIPITFNCSGGISLGAYMAGVFYELTKESVQDEAAILIDVITGASAGAISSIMAAFYLLKPQAEAQELLKEENIKNNVFYQAWVERADIKQIDHLGFLPQEDEITGCKNWSIFSGDYIKQIGTDLLKPSEVKIDSQTRPLAMIMTLTNLQGLLKKYLNNGKEIKSVTSAETRQFLFHSGLENKPNEVRRMWQKVIIGGRASGAFPVAFPPVGDDSQIDSFNLSGCVDEYPRNINEYREKVQKLQELKNICRVENNQLKYIFSYTDGGVLDGLPILKAIDFQRRLIQGEESAFSETEKKLFSDSYISKFNEFQTQWQHQNIEIDNSEARRYIYIQPQPITKLDGRKSLLQKNFAMFQVALKGLQLPKAEHDSQRLKTIREIKDIPVNLNRIDPSNIRLLQDKNSELTEIYEFLKNKLGERFSGENKELLASEFLGSFGGFFDREYREHDFLLGRISGIAWLHENCKNIKTPIPKDELLAQIEAEILQKEPNIKHLKYSHWVRIFRIGFRGIRILLIESINISFISISIESIWQLVWNIIAISLIAGLMVIEILLTLVIYMIEALEFVLAWFPNQVN